LAEAGEDYLLLRLDVPDTSLLLDRKVRGSRREGHGVIDWSA
jgi:hypothetical protein